MIEDVPKNSFSKIVVWKVSFLTKDRKRPSVNAPQKNGDALDPNFGKNISRNIFEHTRDFTSLSVTACWVAERNFLLFVKNGDHLNPNFWIKFFGNIFDHKEDNLGIILSLISGL